MRLLKDEIMMKDYSSDILQNNYFDKLRTELGIDKKLYDQLVFDDRSRPSYRPLSATQETV